MFCYFDKTLLSNEEMRSQITFLYLTQVVFKAF